MLRILTLAILIAGLIAIPMFISEPTSANRLDAYHHRSIDIDICIRCDSPIPGPPGPQGPPGPPGPPGPSRSTVVTLEDNAEGHAAGWDPRSANDQYFVQSPIDLDTGTSIRATYVNIAFDPNFPDRHNTGVCTVRNFDTSTDVFDIVCSGFQQFEVARDGATLTIVITK